MNIVCYTVGIAAALVLFRSEILAGDDFGAAPAALAGPAPRRSYDACALYSYEYGLLAAGRDRVLVRALADGQRETLARRAFRISRNLGYVFGDAHDLPADVLFRKIELRKLGLKEAVHSPGTADEHAVLLRSQPLYEVRCDEAVLITLLLLVGEHVENFDLVAGGSQLLELLLEEDGILGTVSEQDGQIEVLSPVRDGFGHGKERRDAAAAGERDDIRRVPEIFIIEISLGTGGGELVSDGCICEKIVGCKSVRLGLHCNCQHSF